ncbi:MAG: hypothetical protein V3T31_02060, partial [candidate division Zixibacteria bacterium]
KRISKLVDEHTYQIELRNRKPEPITVLVEKKLYGFWEVLDSDFEYVKKDATTITFQADLPADSESQFMMTVRFTRR